MDYILRKGDYYQFSNIKMIVKRRDESYPRRGACQGCAAEFDPELCDHLCYADGKCPLPVNCIFHRTN